MSTFVSAPFGRSANIEDQDNSIDSTNKSTKALNGFVLIISSNGLIRYVSSTVESHLEYTCNEMIGKVIFQFMAEDDYPSIQTALSCLNNNYPVIFPKIFECWMCCKANSYYRRVIMHVAPLRQKQSTTEFTNATNDEEVPQTNSLPGLACLARASKISLSPYPRSALGFGKFTTVLNLPSTKIEQINSCEMNGPYKVDIDVGNNFMDYVHESDRTELNHYFNLVSSTGEHLQSATISSFYRIQIDNTGQNIQWRKALIQSSSILLSKATKEQFRITTPENILIVSTHTVIRLVEDDDSSSSIGIDNANMCSSMMERSANESIIVASPRTNESSKENNISSSPTVLLKVETDNFSQSIQNPVEHRSSEVVLRKNRSHRLLQLLTCGRASESDSSNDFTSENNTFAMDKGSIPTIESAESVCGNIFANYENDHQPQDDNQKIRKRIQHQNKRSTAKVNVRGQISRTKKNKKAQLANAISSSLHTGNYCWTTSATTAQSTLDLAEGVQTLMGIEEIKRTLSKTLFDQENDFGGVITEEELKAIREDPEEREQMIRFVLDSSSTCWHPLSDNFMDIVKSELIKVFQEVSLSPTWHKRESSWMNHALQLAKIQYDRMMEEQQRFQLVQQKTSIPFTKTNISNDPRSVPAYYNQNMNGGELLTDMNDIRLQQQMWLLQQRQRRENLSSSSPMSQSPVNTYTDYEQQIRPVDYMYNVSSPRCPSSNCIVGPMRTPNPQLNDLMYQRQVLMPSDSWQRHCLPVDRRRYFCDTSGGLVAMQGGICPVRTMPRDSRLIVDNSMSDCSIVPSGMSSNMANSLINNRCRSDGMYGNSLHGYSIVPSNVNNSDIYCANPSTPLRVNSECDQISFLQQQQRYRILDQSRLNGFNGYTGSVSNQSEFDRYRQSLQGGDQLMQGVPHVQMMQAGGTHSLHE